MKLRLDPKSRVAKGTPPALKDLRGLRVAVLHPNDSDGQQLTQQLQRIGCQVQAYWPPPADLPEGLDTVFLAVRPDSIDYDLEWTRSELCPTVIAVVTYENPTIVDAVMRLGARAVLPSPVKSFGLMSTLVIGRQIDADLKSQVKRIRKLETKVAGTRRIMDAQNILMRTRNVSEKEAYDLIRDQAMAKRVTTEEIAAAIINANEILSHGNV
jgi:AmiR/NasT family two-component response regulator